MARLPQLTKLVVKESWLDRGLGLLTDDFFIRMTGDGTQTPLLCRLEELELVFRRDEVESSTMDILRALFRARMQERVCGGRVVPALRRYDVKGISKITPRLSWDFS